MSESPAPGASGLHVFLSFRAVWQLSAEPYLTGQKEELCTIAASLLICACTLSRESSAILLQMETFKGMKKKKECREEKETNIELLQRVFFFFSKTCLLSGLYSLQHTQRHLIKPCQGNWQSFSSLHLFRTDKVFLGRFYHLLGSILREKLWQFII